MLTKSRINLTDSGVLGGVWTEYSELSRAGRRRSWRHRGRIGDDDRRSDAYQWNKASTRAMAAGAGSAQRSDADWRSARWRRRTGRSRTWGTSHSDTLGTSQGTSLCLLYVFVADLKLISFTHPFLHSHSYSFRTAFTDLILYCIKGALAMFVLGSFSGYVC